MKDFQLNSEQELLKRLSDGDKFAFELIFFRYKGKIFDFIKRSLPADEDVESLVQDVFTKLWISRNALDADKSLNALLYTMARNEVYGQLRKMLVRRKYIEELNYTLNKSTDNTENQLDYNELKFQIDKLVESLPEKRQEIFKLSRNEGLSYKEIASELGISENTVDTQIRKALNYLRDNLKKKFFTLFFIFSKKRKVIS